jgi:hypothetical protein
VFALLAVALPVLAQAVAGQAGLEAVQQGVGAAAAAAAEGALIAVACTVADAACTSGGAVLAAGLRGRKAQADAKKSACPFPP